MPNSVCRVPFCRVIRHGLRRLRIALRNRFTGLAAACWRDCYRD